MRGAEIVRSGTRLFESYRRDVLDGKGDNWTATPMVLAMVTLALIAYNGYAWAAHRWSAGLRPGFTSCLFLWGIGLFVALAIAARSRARAEGSRPAEDLAAVCGALLWPVTVFLLGWVSISLVYYYGMKISWELVRRGCFATPSRWYA